MHSFSCGAVWFAACFIYISVLPALAEMTCEHQKLIVILSEYTTHYKLVVVLLQMPTTTDVRLKVVLLL